jgi:SAM-dependent methyltransferase
MEPKQYLRMAAFEDVYWWNVARRIILDKVIAELALPDNAEIFEAGCGTGGNLAMLGRHGRVYAMELDEVARSFANDRRLAEIQLGHLPNHIPFAGQSFDLIVLLDVLEHLDEDAASLRALHSRLTPDGWLLITVPAYPFLWSQHDVALHHKRRYLMSSLRRVVSSAGYTVRYVSYFNSLLFPLIAGVRLLQRLFGGGQKANSTMPPKRLNQLLTGLFASERHVIGRFSFPFGVSLLLLAQKQKVKHLGDDSRNLSPSARLQRAGQSS